MSRGTDLRVLLVSTEPAVTRELRDALTTEEAGRFTIEVARSAREAIVALRRLPSEVTLVDIGEGASTSRARTDGRGECWASPRT